VGKAARGQLQERDRAPGVCHSTAYLGTVQSLLSFSLACHAANAMVSLGQQGGQHMCHGSGAAAACKHLSTPDCTAKCTEIVGADALPAK
jgi:hypothetical protein